MEPPNNTNELSATTTDNREEITCLSMRSQTESKTQLKPEIDANKSGNSSDIKTSIADKCDKSVIQKTTQNGTEFDSGIDTSDSCDEKKYKKQSQVKIVRRQHSRSLTTTPNARLGDYNSI